MSRPRITILGKLWLSEDGGLLYSVSWAKPSSLSKSILASSRSLTDHTELVAGDFVVHLEHGVARYCGIRQILATGRAADFLELAFAGDVRLFVPVEQAHKYVVAGSIAGKTVNVFDTQTEQPAWTLDMDLGVRPMTFSTNADGSTKWLFVQLTGFNGFAVVDFATRTEINRIKNPDLPPGKKIVSAGSDP